MTNSPSAARELPDTPDTVAALGDIAATLWREREILEELLYALKVENLVLAAGDPRWLVRADSDVSAAARQLHEQEVLRSMEMERIMSRLGADGDGWSTEGLSLAELAEYSPEPWPTVLVDHRAALLDLTSQIDALTASNREMLQAGERATTEALQRIRTGRVHEAGGEVRYPGGRALPNRSVLDEQA